jgi:hypothetical protein
MTHVESHSRHAIRLFGVGAVFALRPAGRDALAELAAAAPLDATTAYSPNEAIETFEVDSSAKADRLPVVASSDEAKKVVIEPVKVASSQVQAEKAPITSWHWHFGSNKITRK